MRRVYLGIYYLKIIHYFFFSVAVFSLTTGIIFWEAFALESVSFFFVCCVYSVSCLYIARSLYTSYAELADPIIVVKTYILPYPLLAFWTVGLTVFLVYTFPYLTELVHAFLFINYYILFFLVIGILLSRFRVVGKLFDVYSGISLRMAQGVASKHSHFVDVMAYKIGSDPRVDEILDDIWHHRDYPLPQVKELETRMCEIEIKNIEKSIEILEGRSGKTGEEGELLLRLKNEKSEYVKKIEDIQEFGD